MRGLALRCLLGALVVLTAAACALPAKQPLGSVARVSGPKVYVPDPSDVAAAPPALAAAVSAAPEVPPPAGAAPATAAEPEGQPAPPTQLRGVWVHAFDPTLKSEAGIITMLDRVAAAGANTVIVEVIRRHDAFFPSRVLPRAVDPDYDPQFDALSAVVAHAHARELAVHAWYPAMPAWHSGYATIPYPPNWTWAQHGPHAADGQQWVSRSVTGEWGDYLDPGVPAVQDFVVAIGAELAAHGVDAVHVDYLRYEGAEWGYHPVALARFQAETGRSDVPDPADPQWSQWRRNQTTEIIRRLQAAVTDVDPEVGVSAALIAWGDGPVGQRTFASTPAYAQVFQPWEEWVLAGYVDVAMPMLYFREDRHAHFYRNWLTYLQALDQTADAVIAPGQGSFLNEVDASLDQLSLVGGLDGSVLYSYQDTTSAEPKDALLPGLGTTLWAHRAVPPPARRTP